MEGVDYAKQYVLENTTAIKNNVILKETPQTASSFLIELMDANNNFVASMHVEKATHCKILKYSALTRNQMHNCAVMHAPIYRNKKDLPALLYFAARRCRLMQCDNIIYLQNATETNSDVQTMLRLDPLSTCLQITIDNTQYHVSAQRLKYSILLAFKACDDDTKKTIQTFFVKEILDTFQRWVEHLFQDSWFMAIRTETMSREQYITSLYNLHQFVRHTTRLAARAVAMSDDRALRNHYLNHLKGEINHELIIESDLRGLGADVDYLVNEHVAHPATGAFIVVQESTIGYKQDPVLMLACPFIAEGMTANIDTEFVDHLHHVIASFGIAKPESVSRFLTSHMKTDGGVDGHWLRVVMMIHQYIHSEQELQAFLAVMQLAMTGYAQGLNANVEDLQLWQAYTSVECEVS